MRKVMVNGQEVEAKQVSFCAIGEPWTELKLEDGTILRVRYVVTKVFATGMRSPSGELIYSVDGACIFVADDPNS